LHDWNNDNDFHQARAAGPGGYTDFSTWIYVYSEKNHIIANGTNDLTAKLLCSVDNKWTKNSFLKDKNKHFASSNYDNPKYGFLVNQAKRFLQIGFMVSI
jgi:hypothetical protein